MRSYTYIAFICMFAAAFGIQPLVGTLKRVPGDCENTYIHKAMEFAKDLIVKNEKERSNSIFGLIFEKCENCTVRLFSDFIAKCDLEFAHEDKSIGVVKHSVEVVENSGGGYVLRTLT